MTLLQEIQTETSSSGGDLATILRKCKILAARLGSEEFARWITCELDGYPDDQPIPVLATCPVHPHKKGFRLRAVSLC